MPSKSDKQRRFMAAAAHNPKFAKRAGIKQSVAQEFNQADTKPKYQSGGLASVAKNYFQRQPNPGGIMKPRPGAMVNPMYRRPPNPGGPIKQRQRIQVPPSRPMPAQGGLSRFAQQGQGNPMSRMFSQMRGQPGGGGGGLAQMMQQMMSQRGGGPGGPTGGFPAPGGVPGRIGPNSPYTAPGGPSGPVRRPQQPPDGRSGFPGTIQAGKRPNDLIRTAGAASGRFGSQLNRLMSGLGNRQQFAGGGGVRKALKKQRLLVDGRIINPGDVLEASDGERLIFQSISRYNEQGIGGNSSGKIIVEPESQSKIREALRRFWDTYFDDPTVETDANAEYLEDNLSRSEMAEAHEAYELDSGRRMENLLMEFEGHTREYYPGVFEGKLAEPPIKRVKQQGGRIRMAGGGKIKRALRKIQDARFELEETADPDIDLLAREMMKDSDLRLLGRRLLANEKKVEKMSIEEAERYYQRISRLFDEAESKASE